MHKEIEYTQLEGAPAQGASTPDLSRLCSVPVELAVEIGRTRMTIGETLALGPGSIVTLNRLAGEPVDLLVNGKRIARGEVVVIDEEFGLRITEVVSVARRVNEAQRSAEGQAPGATDADQPAGDSPSSGAGIAPPPPVEAPTEPAQVTALEDSIVWEDPGEDVRQ